MLKTLFKQANKGLISTITTDFVITRNKMSTHIFPESRSNNRLASVTLRVEQAAFQDLINYYIEKIGFEKVELQNKSSKITGLAIPQGIFPAPGHTSCTLNLNPIALKKYAGSKRLDTYWKIGLQLHDVDGAAEQMSISKGSQFMDIGYLTHMTDPAGFTIELLQTTFEGNKADRDSLYGAQKRDEYQKFIQNQLPSIQGSSVAANQPLTIGQITIRSSDKGKSLDFYQNVLGMKLVSIQDVSKFGFELYFLAYTSDNPPTETDLNDVSIREWLWQRKYTQLEIQCRISNEPISLTHNGYSNKSDDLNHLPSGLQSIQIEINEADLLEKIKNHKTFNVTEDEQKVIVANGEKDRKLVGSVYDPDGIRIEVITKADMH